MPQWLTNQTAETKTEARWDTWTQTSKTTKFTNKGKSQIDAALEKHSKEKVIKQLENLKTTEPKTYEDILAYINNK
jgi:restriction endonuclease Mrr